MENKSFAYIRVSSKDQHVDRQITALKKYVATDRDIFIDKQSGHTFERAAYQGMKQHLRAGDTVYIKSLDRFGRNKEEIKNELEWFKKKRIIVRILDVPTSMMDFERFGSLQQAIMEMVNNILIEVLGTFAEQERHMIKERQREGIASAKKKGVKFGRPAAQYPQGWDTYYKRWQKGEITAIHFMRETGLKRATFYNLVNRYKDKQ